ncbi:MULTISPECIES: glycoside hydrolase family 65 protein [unclassified Fusibacter]|uniref:glycoside hydrolase family 65 protein n=1 Tax=unclassified Fusibacter TaxID=2624464 RepID=UPI0019D71CEB|nr:MULTISPECIES: glycosyl hydrolase family 65 protein [unclassified Fusibacter]MCK8060471.1 family 65 glycosyl hydrolase [Fusibacter sp. A2]
MDAKELDQSSLLIDETLYTTANGYLGIRACFEEGYPEQFKSIRGSYINGFYDEIDIVYGENAYGFPQHAQKMLNVIDPQGIEIHIDDERFSYGSGTVHSTFRELDVEKGYALRKVEWESSKGHRLEIGIKRMASFHTLELFTIDYTVKSLNFSGRIEVKSTLDGNVKNYTDSTDPRVASGHEKMLLVTSTGVHESVGSITAKTMRSELVLVASMSHSVEMKYLSTKDTVIGSYVTTIGAGDSFNFVKYVTYTDSIRHEDLLEKNIEINKEVRSKGVAFYYREQQNYLDEFWNYALVDIKGDKAAEEALHYSTYQLMASVGKDKHCQLPAKGLTGEGYEGHYFWDTEIYAVPMMTLTKPDIARSLLAFRYSTLDSARERARTLGHLRGAKIPWRTIAGSECSGYFPAGTAQYHINADVAYAAIQYYLVTKDLKSFLEFAFELLLETARLWIEVGHYSKDGQFKIDAVTGPDEYTAIVNNNYYTNAMAKYHLLWTHTIAGLLAENHPSEMKKLSERLDLTKEELLGLRRASDKMYLPYKHDENLCLQDDSFYDKKDWDLENTPKENHPLLLHYHPLTIYRHKVLKQADTVLAHLLLDNESEEYLKASYDYYEKYTTHDSSLSPCIYSMMAARIGDTEKAYSYFVKTLRLDLDNLHHNTKDGLHLANAGGAYMGIVYGFGGLRIKSDGIHLSPVLPSKWESYQFRFRYQESCVRIYVGDSIRIETDAPVRLVVYGMDIVVKGKMEVDRVR